MNIADTPTYTHFIGWDVGGWNCENNRNSRDAMVVLDAAGKFIGKSKRGNFADEMNTASCPSDWIKRVLGRLDLANNFPDDFHVLMAIDAPLGLPEALVNLAGGDSLASLGWGHGFNPYLFRYTERRLYESKVARPLSTIKDMIGSQATKAMHMIARFGLVSINQGVWRSSSSGSSFTVIETYPAAVASGGAMDMLSAYLPFVGTDGWHRDDIDALHCAMVARLFATERALFSDPPSEAPKSEGWIWLPDGERELV